MGLDMYLTKKHYVKNWDHYTKEERIKITITKGGKPLKINNISEVVEEIATWRKANQIHKWFVDNIQDGEDDCKKYYVPDEKLEELLNVCKIVKQEAKLKKGKIVNGYSVTKNGDIPILEDGEYITNADIIHDLLPNSEGFFFGSQDYDQWYMMDIDYTIQQLTEALKNKNGSFYYQSSW